MSYEKICEEIKKYLNDVDSFEDEAVEISNFIDDKVRERMRRKMYCENCFKEEVKEYYEDRLGSIFCDKECYLDSAKWRDIENE